MQFLDFNIRCIRQWYSEPKYRALISNTLTLNLPLQLLYYHLANGQSEAHSAPIYVLGLGQTAEELKKLI